MTDLNDDIHRVLSDIERVLKEQRELFGDVLYVNPTQSRPIVTGLSEEKETMTVRKKPAGVPEEVDLFGNVISPGPARVTRAAGGRQAYPDEPWVGAGSLDELEGMICTCTKCPLGYTRTKFVFGVGSPQADVVLVGEAPGADEDLQGEPFVGRAGQLLNKILEAINFRREEVYICNILKCRPPSNREPQPEEIDTCEPYLWKQLELLKPKFILCLGRVAGQTLLRTTETLNGLRGKVHDYRGIKLMVTYHPAALLRNPHWKRPTWEDLQLFRKLYDEMKRG